MSVPFATRIDAHAARLHRAALAMLGDREAAKDVAQEALVKAYAARESFDDGRPFYPWLHRILKNTVRDLARQRKRWQWTELAEEHVPSAVGRPDEPLGRRQDRERLWRAMGALPEAQREVLSLRHFEELSYAEMAEVLDVAEGTVMSRLFRARRALADALSTLADDNCETPSLPDGRHR